MSGALLLVLASGPALAQSLGAPTQQASTANERLLEELQQIIDQAEQNRSASTLLIEQLRDLARRYA